MGEWKLEDSSLGARREERRLLDPLPQPLIERIAACRGVRPSMALERSLVSGATWGVTRLASRDAALLSSAP